MGANPTQSPSLLGLAPGCRIVAGSFGRVELAGGVAGSQPRAGRGTGSAIKPGKPRPMLASSGPNRVLLPALTGAGSGAILGGAVGGFSALKRAGNGIFVAWLEKPPASWPVEVRNTRGRPKRPLRVCPRPWLARARMGEWCSGLSELGQ